MFLSTITTSVDTFEVRYRDERIAQFPVAQDHHFEETCEHLLSGGVRVDIIDPYVVYDEYD